MSAKLRLSLRKHLVERCRAYGNATCRLLACNGVDDKGSGCAMSASSSLLRAFRIKASSVFCLEPPGFGLARKSLVDGLNLGCIPVMFTPAKVCSGGGRARRRRRPRFGDC